MRKVIGDIPDLILKESDPMNCKNIVLLPWVRFKKFKMRKKKRKEKKNKKPGASFHQVMNNLGEIKVI